MDSYLSGYIPGLAEYAIWSERWLSLCWYSVSLNVPSVLQDQAGRFMVYQWKVVFFQTNQCSQGLHEDTASFVRAPAHGGLSNVSIPQWWVSETTFFVSARSASYVVLACVFLYDELLCQHEVIGSLAHPGVAPYTSFDSYASWLHLVDCFDWKFDVLPKLNPLLCPVFLASPEFWTVPLTSGCPSSQLPPHTHPWWLRCFMLGGSSQSLFGEGYLNCWMDRQLTFCFLFSSPWGGPNYVVWLACPSSDRQDDVFSEHDWRDWLSEAESVWPGDDSMLISIWW